jgi:hypothetical protein
MISSSDFTCSSSVDGCSSTLISPGRGAPVAIHRGNGQSIRQIWWPPPRSSRGRQRSVLWPSPFRISWPLTPDPGARDRPSRTALQALLEPVAEVPDLSPARPPGGDDGRGGRGLAYTHFPRAKVAVKVVEDWSLASGSPTSSRPRRPPPRSRSSSPMLLPPRGSWPRSRPEPTAWWTSTMTTRLDRSCSPSPTFILSHMLIAAPSGWGVGSISTGGSLVAAYCLTEAVRRPLAC